MKKANLRLIAKDPIDKTVFLLTYVVDQEISWEPGQYANLTLGEKLRRPYTILTYDKVNNTVQFLIDIAPGGEASKYLETTNIGDQIEGFFSMGEFKYISAGRKSVMVATGTGIAPLVSMLKQASTIPNSETLVLWGVRNPESNYLDNLFDDSNRPEIIRCISAASEPGDYYQGRVTKYIEEELSKEVDFADRDYYLCGQTSVVQSIGELLESLGVAKERIISERY